MNQVKIAHTPQILLGVLLVGCLFYSQSLVAIYARHPFGAANIVGGGILSGGLHALSGPDHLAALLPFILGQKWINASHYGFFWGFGHGLTTSMMGVFGFYVKDSLLANKLMPQLTNLADYAVGVTLILIGVMGVYESWQTNLVEKIADSDIIVVESCIVTTVEIESEVPKATSNSLSVLLTIFANGCFLGMSWDGIPSLAPTLSLYSWQMLFAFLLSYCVGTVFTIGVASGFIGESTKWLSTVTSEDLPRKLALISSICAMVIGVMWILQALIKLIEVKEEYSKFSTPWLLCCVMAMGTPIALVGIIIMAINTGTVTGTASGGGKGGGAGTGINTSNQLSSIGINSDSDTIIPLSLAIIKFGANSRKDKDEDKDDNSYKMSDFRIIQNTDSCISISIKKENEQYVDQSMAETGRSRRHLGGMFHFSKSTFRAGKDVVEVV